ncbi:MAG: outer membrane beta-barrel protein [Sterolibacterium sp.]|nr:outer membrane beta-barrel protein [Sterolibacterium sp.]
MKHRPPLVASLILACTTLAVANSVQALEFSEDMYLVASVGKAIKKHTPMQLDSDARIKAGVPGGTLVGFNSAQTAGKNGYKLQLGYQLTENFALEGGYVNLGKLDYNAAYTYNAGLQKKTGEANRTVKVSGINVSLLASNPINEDISVFAKAGGIYAQVKTSHNSSSNGAATGLGNGTLDKTRWRGVMGVGANYRIDEDFGIRAEFERYNKLGDKNTVGTLDINMMSLGLIGKF